MPTLPTPNMNLNLPVVGQELGPQYGSDNNAAFFQVDSHNHTSGQGVQIPTAGININTDLPFNGNNATSLNAVIFNSNSMPLAGSSPYLNAVYVSGGNLYYNDGAGNQVKITNNGTVNATSSGISSGTATASFVGGVLVVNQAAFTPGNIQAGSILIGNNVANSFFVSLNAPNALSSDYNVTLPPTNNTSNTVFLTYDSSNNMGLGPNVSGGLTTANLSPTAGILPSQLAFNPANNPSGSVIMYTGTSAPSGYFMCDGTAYSRTTYATLFAVIGTAYGNGDGSTTFNVPDFRGIFPRGVDAGAGNDPDTSSRTAVNGGNSGDNVGSLQQNAYTSHYHGTGFQVSDGTAGASGPTLLENSNVVTSTTRNSNSPTGGNTSSETRPINLYVNFIIKT